MSFISRIAAKEFGVPEINLNAALAPSLEHLKHGDIEGFLKSLPSVISHEIVRHVALEKLGETVGVSVPAIEKTMSLKAPAGVISGQPVDAVAAALDHVAAETRHLLEGQTP